MVPVATPPTRPVLRERYESKRRRVVTTAARVFAKRGYDQTSIKDVADELGVAAGGLYHYFSGKEELLIAICDELMDPLLAEARRTLDEHEAPEPRLRALVRLWVRHVVEHRDHMLVFQQVRHAIERGDQWRRVRKSRKDFERLVDAVLAEIPRSGHGPAADRRLALAALLGMVNHTAQWFKPRGRLTSDDVAEGYVDLLLGRG